MALAPRRLQCIPARLSRVPAVSLHHTRRGAQTLSVKFGIAHAVLVALDMELRYSRAATR